MSTPSLFKRGNTYWIRYTVNNQQIKESTKSKDIKLAQQYLSKRQVELFIGVTPPKNAALTLQQLRDIWVEIKYNKKTLSDDIQKWKFFLKYMKPTTLISHITPNHIIELRKILQSKDLKPATINRHLELLSASLNLAEKQGYQTQSPFKVIPRLQVDNERNRIATPEEYTKLLNAAKPELRLAITIGYYTALRLGEISKLRWENIDLQKGIAFIEAAHTKTNRHRFVPLHTNVIEALNQIRKDYGSVFRANSYRLSKRFIRLKKKMGYHDLTFHDFRHTALTRLHKAGNDVLVLKAISGHTSTKMLNRYVRVDNDDLLEAVGKLKD